MTAASTEAEPPVPPAEPRRPTKWSAATRYLCAAAHLDEEFADRAIEEDLEHPYRPFVPSYGVDLVPVLLHCLQARRRRTVRDALLTVVALAALFHISRWLFLTLDPNRPAPDLWPGIVIPLALIWVIDFTASRACRRALGRLQAGSFDPDEIRIKPNARRRKRLDEIAEEQERCNVIVHSGFSPFVGSGVRVAKSWSFVVDVSKGKDLNGKPAKPLSFGVEELYDAVEKAVRGLQLKGLAVEGHLYVNGWDVRYDPRFLPGRFARPRAYVASPVVSQVRRTPTSTVRYYQRIAVTEWGGELILSIYLHFSKVGPSLYAAGHYFLLMPVKSAHHRVDMLRVRTFRNVCALAWEEAITAPAALLGAPFRLGEPLFDPWVRRRTRRELRRAIRSNYAFNYGADGSLREYVADDDWHRYFQMVDDDMCGKIVHNRIFNEIIMFLDHHKLDSGDFRKFKNPFATHGLFIQDPSRGDNPWL